MTQSTICCIQQNASPVHWLPSFARLLKGFSAASRSLSLSLRGVSADNSLLLNWFLQLLNSMSQIMNSACFLVPKKALMHKQIFARGAFSGCLDESRKLSLQPRLPECQRDILQKDKLQRTEAYQCQLCFESWPVCFRLAKFSLLSKRVHNF